MTAPDESAAKRVRCPVCNAQPGFSCRQARSLKDVRFVTLKRPHPQRVAAAKEG